MKSSPPSWPRPVRHSVPITLSSPKPAIRSPARLSGQTVPWQAMLAGRGASRLPILYSPSPPHPRYHPVGLDVADFAGKVGAGESEAHAGGGPGCRKVYVSNESVRMRRPEDRQIKNTAQIYVVDIAPVASEEFEILSSAQRLADIGRRLRCL